MSQIVIYGNGQLAKLAFNRIKHDSFHQTVAFTVDGHLMESNRLLDLPLVPFERVVEHYPPDVYQMFIAVGHIKINQIRADRYEKAKEYGYRFINYISSKAIVWPEVEMGENCLIGDGCVIQPYARLGNDVHVGTASIVGHDAVIGDHCYLAVNVVLAGSVTVEPYAFLGASVTVRDRVRIGQATVIGAGAVIGQDTKPQSVYAGPTPQLLPITSDRLPLF
ncbi:MAG: acetyltransferase [Candidatus Competibacteraceae bacterium]